MAYHILINEEQRAALLEVLQSAERGLVNPVGDVLEGYEDPLQYWQSMLTELPNQEKENPGILHGFCL